MGLLKTRADHHKSPLPLLRDWSSTARKLTRSSAAAWFRGKTESLADTEKAHYKNLIGVNNLQWEKTFIL
jgi:hypothetical protein